MRRVACVLWISHRRRLMPVVDTARRSLVVASITKGRKRGWGCVESRRGFLTALDTPRAACGGLSSGGARGMERPSWCDVPGPMERDATPRHASLRPPFDVEAVSRRVVAE
jgi:hypothetical protein